LRIEMCNYEFLITNYELKKTKIKKAREAWRTRLTTEAAKFAKLRPMRVEMFLHVQTKTNEDLKPCITCKNIAAGSGETT